MLFHAATYSSYPTTVWLQVLWHSLPHDLTLASYVMALPLVLYLLYVWLPGSWYGRLMRGYLTVVIGALFALWLIDLPLFGYWGYRLDTTPFLYFLDSPREALASTSLGVPLLGLIGLAVFVGLLWLVLGRMYRPVPRSSRRKKQSTRSWANRIAMSLLTVLVAGLLVVAMRGGVTASTMNVGRAYFSQDMVLNHAATNPVFSLFYSLGKYENFASQYRFMSEEEALTAWEELHRRTAGKADTAPRASLLRTTRPNILLIIFEGFSGAACHALYPEADPRIMPTVNRMYKEGIGFTRFYANSWRTDRGVTSILAGYPAQPTYSVMKNQQICDRLPYLTRSLQKEGYDLQFLYGGDVNFTNMKGFLSAGGVEHIISDQQFPLVDRLSKWGVPDHITFARLYDEIIDSNKKEAPFCKIFLTLSSHEPFEVPFSRLDDPYCNSVAYADSCLNDLLEKLQQTPLWDNLLVIGLPDHCIKYPESISFEEPLRYHIPMFWTGGAILQPCLVDTYGQQTDLTATLLSQLEIPHEEFQFSKDMLHPASPHFAFFDYPDGFGLLTDSCSYIQDNQKDGVPLSGSHDPQGHAQRWGKAYLQRLYSDMATKQE